MIVFSLLHATRATPQRALETRAKWLQAAKRPQDVEHIFAFQDDDEASARELAQSVHVTTPAPPDWASSSVANWNAAASISTGEWLIVIADDLFPTPDWDALLASDIAETPNPTQPLAIQAHDGINSDWLLRHPIVNRSLYDARGFIFHPDFYGVFCDNDLTAWCFENAKVKMAQHFSVLHVHPISGARKHDEISKLQNSKRAYEYGAEMMRKHWNDDGSSKRNLTTAG